MVVSMKDPILMIKTMIVAYSIGMMAEDMKVYGGMVLIDKKQHQNAKCYLNDGEIKDGIWEDGKIIKQLNDA